MKILEILEFKLKSKVKDASILTSLDFKFIKFMDFLKSMIFLSSMGDIILYTAHELLHHDLKIEQTSSASLSLFFAFFMFNVCMIEFFKIFQSLRKINLKEFLKFKRELLRTEKDLKMLELKIKKFRRCQIGGEKEMKLKVKFMDEMEEIKTQKEFFEKNFLFRFGSISSTLVEGIKLEHLDPSSFSIYYRFLKIVKIAIFEILIVSLQSSPKFQISLITLTQLYFFINTVFQVIWKKIFENGLWSIVEIFDEFTISFFLVVSFLMEFYQRDEFSVETWTRMQFYCIYLIVLSSILNFFVAFLTGFNAFIRTFGSFFWYTGTFGLKSVNREIEEIDEILKEKFSLEFQNEKKNLESDDEDGSDCDDDNEGNDDEVKSGNDQLRIRGEDSGEEEKISEIENKKHEDILNKELGRRRNDGVKEQFLKKDYIEEEDDISETGNKKNMDILNRKLGRRRKSRIKEQFLKKEDFQMDIIPNNVNARGRRQQEGRNRNKRKRKKKKFQFLDPADFV